MSILLTLQYADERGLACTKPALFKMRRVVHMQIGVIMRARGDMIQVPLIYSTMLKSMVPRIG